MDTMKRMSSQLQNHSTQYYNIYISTNNNINSREDHNNEWGFFVGSPASPPERVLYTTTKHPSIESAISNQDEDLNRNDRLPFERYDYNILKSQANDTSKTSLEFNFPLINDSDDCLIGSFPNSDFDFDDNTMTAAIQTTNTSTELEYTNPKQDLIKAETMIDPHCDDMYSNTTTAEEDDSYNEDWHDYFSLTSKDSYQHVIQHQIENITVSIDNNGVERYCKLGILQKLEYHKLFVIDCKIQLENGVLILEKNPFSDAESREIMRLATYSKCQPTISFLYNNVIEITSDSTTANSLTWNFHCPCYQTMTSWVTIINRAISALIEHEQYQFQRVKQQILQQTSTHENAKLYQYETHSPPVTPPMTIYTPLKHLQQVPHLFIPPSPGVSRIESQSRGSKKILQTMWPKPNYMFPDQERELVGRT